VKRNRNRPPPEIVVDPHVGEIFVYRPWRWKLKRWLATARLRGDMAIDSIRSYGLTREDAIDALRSKWAARRIVEINL
jgi:hypothetical protein